MKKHTLNLATLIAIITLLAASANALPIPPVDGTTNVITSPTTGDSLLVGEFQPNSQLTVSAPSGSVDVIEVRIGDGSVSDNNKLIVTDAGSTVTASGDLHIGYDGSGNSLRIENGGSVSAQNVNLGFAVGSDGNSATVTDTGSMLSVADSLHVGRNGTGNNLTVESNAWVLVGNVNSGTVASVDAGAIAVGSGGEMIIENGSTVNSDNGYIGLGTNDTGTATVSGSGSAWNVATNLHVGYAGSNNTLTVNGDAVVNADNAFIGTLQSASNNTVTVTGTGSALNATDSLFVGGAGSLNTLDIQNGAEVTAAEILVGYVAGANGNTINITGNGSVLMASDNLSVTGGSNNTVNINNGGLAYVGNNLITDSNNQVNLNSGGTLQAAGDLDTSTAGFNFGAGSTLEVGGALTHNDSIENGRNVIINGALGSNDASWTAVDVRVGDSTAGNSLTVTGGGTVTSAGGVRLGVDPGTDNNTLTVTGSNSTLNSAGLVIVGQRGQNNKMDILNGGSVTAGDDFWIGENPVSADNTVNVSGSNSSLAVAGELHVGKNTDGNTLNVLAGGNVTASNGVYAGSGTGSDNNTVTVSGNDSTLAAVGELTIGEEGANNTLNVGDNGSVRADTILIGENGSGNSLQVTSDASVESGSLVVGANSDNNAATVSGSNSTVSIDNQLRVGIVGSANSLTVNSGKVNAGDMDIGYLGSNNTVAVAGTNSSLRVGNILTIGELGSYNSMAVSGGASVMVSNAVEVGSVSSSNNSLTVSGSDTSMDVLTDATISGIDNALNVANGALLVIGELNTDITNLPSSASGVLAVGNSNGSANLMATDGAGVQAGNIYLGAESDSIGFIGVIGSSSTLAATDELHIGLAGSSNELSIAGGASATADMISIGTGSNANHNEIRLNGSESTLAATGDLYVGDFGSGNELLIENGATGTASTVVIGKMAGADNNIVTIDGNGSALDAGTLVVGQDGSNNSLGITNGAVLEIGVSTLLINAGTGSNNAVNLNRGGTLKTAGDFDAEQEGFNFNAGSTLEVGGTLTSTNAIEGEQNIVLNGSSASWEPGTNLYVGGTTTGNSLTLLDGATVNTITGYIGMAAGADNNVVTVAGSNSTLMADTLTVGVDGSDNMLNIVGNGTVVITNNLKINDGAGLNNQVLLNNGGTLKVVGNFNAQTGGLVIGSGSSLEVGGTLTSIGTIDNGSALVVNGNLSTEHAAVWDATGGDLKVGESNDLSVLSIIGGGSVTGNNTHIGFATGSDSNSINVTGTDSILIVDILNVGSSNNIGNALNIASGGTVLINDSLSMNTNNMVNLNRDGTLQFAGNFDLTNAETNGLVFNAGGILEVRGALTATNAIDGERNIVLNGGSAMWNVGTNLLIGSTTAENSLAILNGSSVTSQEGIIGSGSANNSVEVNGADSTWDILGSLMVGTGGTGNRLLVDDGGTVSVGNDLVVTNGSILNIGSTGGITVSSNYTQDASSILKIGAGTNSAGRLTVGNIASLEGNTTIEVYNDGTFNGTNDVYDYTILDAGTLLVAGTNATTGTLSNEVYIVNSGISELFLIVDENTIRAREYLLSLAEATGTEGTMLGAVADDIDAIAKQGGTNNLGVLTRGTIGQLEQQQAGSGAEAMDNYYGEKASAAPIHNVINKSVGSFASELRVHGDNARERAGMASASLNRSGKPAGPAGPFNPDQGLQGWIKGYGTWVDKSEEGSFGAYDGTIYGTLIGFDFPVAANILLGFAGGYSTSSIDKDNGATSDAKTRFASIYTSVGTDEWFFDGSLIYGDSDVGYTLGDVFDTEADYTAKNYAFYLGGGRELMYDYLIVTPEISVLANYYEQNAYDEDSTTAVPREVDAFDTWYLKSSLGCNVGMYVGIGEMTIKPELRLHWIHEFNADEETLPYALSGGTGQHQMTLQAPEEDILQLGAGFSAQISEYLEIRLDADLRAASDYSEYGVSGKIRYQF